MCKKFGLLGCFGSIQKKEVQFSNPDRQFIVVFTT